MLALRIVRVDSRTEVLLLSNTYSLAGIRCICIRIRDLAAERDQRGGRRVRLYDNRVTRGHVDGGGEGGRGGDTGGGGQPLLLLLLWRRLRGSGAVRPWLWTALKAHTETQS